MFSIICPTMWRGEGLKPLIEFAETSPYIGEVLVINNASDVTPAWFEPKAYRKIRTYDPGCNIYVNPSWNLGVILAVSDKICLMNDDIEFDFSVFEFMNDKLGADVGPAGPIFPISLIDGPVRLETDSDLRWKHLIDLPGSTALGWGTLIFLNRKNWFPIPEQLKIFCGDSWIQDQSWAHGKAPRTLHNFNIKGKLGTTSERPEFNSIKMADESARELLNTIWPHPHGN